MNYETWLNMSQAERATATDYSDLHPQLKHLKGARVEVVDQWGEQRRFYVGQSTGWKPCNLEVHNRRSLGGVATVGVYQSVKFLYWK